MKVTRSVKCHFSEWLTDTKKRQLRRYLSEYHRVVTEAIKLFEVPVCNGMKKTELLLAKNLIQVDSWLCMLTVLRSKAELHGGLLLPTGARRLQTSWCELQQLLLRASSGGSIQVRSNRGRVRTRLDVSSTG